MTEKEIDALEAAARGATHGPWITKKQRVYHAYDNGTYCDVPVCEANFGATAAYVAAASPQKILELIAELKQAKELCEEHEEYITELEQSLKVYDRRIGEIIELLGIEHDEGSYAKISYIYHNVKQLQEKLRQAKAERDWLAHHFDQRPCERDDQCAFELSKRDCHQPSQQCWIDAAKSGVEAAKESIC